MIKVTCDKGRVELEMVGNTAELSADTLVIVHSVFETIFNEDVISAMAFRDFIENHISDTFVLEEVK